MSIQFVTALFHIIWCYICMFVYDLGVPGAALATTITYLLQFLLSHSYCSLNHELKDAWILPDRECLNDLYEFMQIST